MVLEELQGVLYDLELKEEQEAEQLQREEEELEQKDDQEQEEQGRGQRQWGEDSLFTISEPGEDREESEEREESEDSDSDSLTISPESGASDIEQMDSQVYFNKKGLLQAFNSFFSTIFLFFLMMEETKV